VKWEAAAAKVVKWVEAKVINQEKWEIKNLKNAVRVPRRERLARAACSFKVK